MKVSIKIAWLIFLIGGLFGCAPITPLPTIRPPPLPAPQPPGMPSTGLPSSGVPSLPGGQPSQPSGGQPSGGQPSGGQPSSGQPSGSPGAPSSAGGGDPSSYDQLPSGGLGGDGSSGEPGGEPDSTFETEGESDGDSGAENGSPGNEGEPSWEDIAGTGNGDSESEGGDGWEVSNELPGNGPESDGDAEGDGDGDGDGDGKSGPGDDEFQGALEEFDGEILAELEIAKTSTGQSNIPTPGDATAGATQEDNTIRALPRRNDRQAPSPPPPRRSGEKLPDHVPDAKDDDIIARQLREAAMLEIDPVLKEKLWEEYRKYKKG